jgi:xanthosine utilization system XapX-like protein
MSVDLRRTLRGALAGGVAAGVWLAQQPLDKRVFGSEYDDAALLARIVGGDLATGAVMHVQNGVLFGAVYANVAPRLPVPAPLRGPLAGLVEHLVTWPSIAFVDSRLAGDGRAFAQSTWRHLLFGFVLGELERRLNAGVGELEPVDEAAVASNGHGTVEHLVASGPAPR